MRTEDKKADETANTNETGNINEAENTEKQQVKSKVTPFRYPYNESEDPEIDAFILQGLQEEADEAEARVNSDPELSQINPPEDQYDKIVARLKEMGIWEEDEEEEELPEEERKKEVAEAREEIAAANRGRKLGDLGREDLEREDLEREDLGEAGLEGENLENIYGNGKELPEQGSSEAAASDGYALR